MVLKNKKKENTEKKLPGLNTLKIIVGSMLGLSTLAIILIFTDFWFIGGFFAIISYILLIVLSGKILLAKN